MSNKKTSSYQFLLWTLYILSAVIVLVSLCVPVFKLEMGLESEGEWAILVSAILLPSRFRLSWDSDTYPRALSP